MKFLIYFSLLLSFSFLSLSAICQNRIVVGPMMGHVDMTTANIWVQFESTSYVTIDYWEKGAKDPDHVTRIPKLRSNSNRTADFRISNLKPGTVYQYEFQFGKEGIKDASVYEFQTQELWQYRMDPPEFVLATGSCAYINEEEVDRPGNPYGGDYEIFDAMAEDKPDLMLWLGDNVYFRETDWTSYEGMCHRYTHTRSVESLNAFLQVGQHYAIWDDHDFGPNNSDRSFLLKFDALRAFKSYWANPGYGVNDQGGITTQFEFKGIDFFLLDNRTFRTSPDLVTDKPQMLGKEQIDWLIEALKFSNSPIKIIAVGGQVLSDLNEWENYARYPEERRMLLERIDLEGIEGVLFLTGDRHHTELSEHSFDDGRKIFDLTVSPLTSSSYDHFDEANSKRVQGSMFCERNYATLSFSGTQKDRKLIIQVFDVIGNELWKKEINQDDFRKD